MIEKFIFRYGIYMFLMLIFSTFGTVKVSVFMAVIILLVEIEFRFSELRIMGAKKHG